MNVNHKTFFLAKQFHHFCQDCEKYCYELNPFRALDESDSSTKYMSSVPRQKPILFRVWYQFAQHKIADKVSKVKIVFGAVGAVKKTVICKKTADVKFLTNFTNIHSSDVNYMDYLDETFLKQAPKHPVLKLSV